MPEDNSEHEITITPVQALEVNTAMPKRHIRDAIVPPPVGAELLAEISSYELNEYLNSIDMPDQRIAEPNQQQDFATKQKLIKSILVEAKDAAQQAAYRHIAQHPEAEGLGFKFSGRVYAEKYKRVNLSPAFISMLDYMIDSKSEKLSQKAILDSAKQSTGIHVLNKNIWNMPLRMFMKAKLKERLQSHGLQISLTSCSNMSEVRKAITTFYAKKEAIQKLKLDLTITPNEIIVNGNTYAITTTTTGGYSYRKIRLQVNNRRKWLNVDELTVLFGLNT